MSITHTNSSQLPWEQQEMPIPVQSGHHEVVCYQQKVNINLRVTSFRPLRIIDTWQRDSAVLYYHHSMGHAERQQLPQIHFLALTDIFFCLRHLQTGVNMLVWKLAALPEDLEYQTETSTCPREELQQRGWKNGYLHFRSPTFGPRMVVTVLPAFSTRGRT